MCCSTMNHQVEVLISPKRKKERERERDREGEREGEREAEREGKRQRERVSHSIYTNSRSTANAAAMLLS